jgi:hypothetical protein
MNAFHIKLLALGTMFIDHIGLFFFPESFLLRTIGRISFPLFAWLIANGAYHTKNINKYFVRLFVFALISQIPYWLALRYVDPATTTLNIFFTLSIALGAIILIRKTSLQIHWVLIALLSAVLATVLNTDYGGFGVLSIISFYLFFKNKGVLIFSQIVIYILMSFYFLSLGNSLGLIQFFGLLALIPITLYNGKPGAKMKYLFYAIYPIHYVLIYFALVLF